MKPKTRNYRKLYALLKKMPNAEKEMLVLQFTNNRTESLTEMTSFEYSTMLAVLDGNVATQSKQVNDADVWRKRCMASIGGWLKAMGLQSNASIVKGIACKATGIKVEKNVSTTFNEIPVSKLRAIYAEFNNKQKVAKNTKMLNANKI